MSRAVKAALALASLPLLLGLAWVLLYVVGNARLSGALDELAEAGYATSLPELAPSPTPSQRAAAAAYSAAFALDPGTDTEALDKPSAEGFAALSAEEKAALDALLKGGAEWFAALRRARAAGTARFDWDYAQGFQMELPELSKSLSASRALTLRAQAEAAAGRDAEARECVRDILGLADAYQDAPLQIGQLIRWALLNRAVETLHRCVGPSTDPKGWLDVLPPPESLDGSVELALRGELASAAMLMKGGAQVVESWALLAPWSRLSAASYLRSLRDLIERARGPYAATRAELSKEENRLKAESGVFNFWALLLPAVSRVLDNERATRAGLALARAGLAAEVERAEKGRYPEKFDAIDPLSGRPFVRNAERLESVGVPGSFQSREEARHVWTFRRP